jgi:protein-tyrosine phosphatase
MRPEESDGRARTEDRRRTAPLEQADPAQAYRIDWIEARELADGARGRLGMTFLPGKHGVSGRYPGVVYARVLADDLAELLRQGVRHLLLLVEDHELRRWGDPDIVAVAAESGITIRRHALPDGTAPPTVAEMAAILDDLRAHRREGDVAVACMGGVGRTGTVAACALVEAGLAADAAVNRVRRLRHPDAVETAQQRDFVRRYARQRRGAAAGSTAPEAGQAPSGSGSAQGTG